MKRKMTMNRFLLVFHFNVIVQSRGVCFCYNLFLFYSVKSKISLHCNHEQ